MPWLAVSEKNLPQLTKGEKIEITKVELYEVFCLVMNFLNNILFPKSQFFLSFRIASPPFVFFLLEEKDI